jgi:hypothetical protein
LAVKVALDSHEGPEVIQSPLQVDLLSPNGAEVRPRKAPGGLNGSHRGDTEKSPDKYFENPINFS